ncbi:hypothetical protein PUN28_010053 [Cardiocondyla obscurior]|uniref:Protein G12 n=1 Tax=Cardiocondyla obscurior TaxID=286306 RepID=A0AAW2FNA6_9HYME
MKFTLVVVAILAVMGLGQAHQFPDFGRGPLHEDLQDILDLVPVQDCYEIFVSYVLFDKEVQEFIVELDKSKVIRDLMVNFQSIPEVNNFMDYLRKEGLNVFNVIKTLNKSVKELVPVNSYNLILNSAQRRTGGLRGLFKDIREYVDYDAFLSLYVDKLKTSTAFANFVNELKSDNTQQIINKAVEIRPLQYLVSSLKNKSVNVKHVADVLYLLFELNVPSPSPKNLVQELYEFVELLPAKDFVGTIVKYLNEDEQVRAAISYMFEEEFHDLLRAYEATEEFQALVAYLEEAGLPITAAIQEWHRAIGMEKYVPSKLDSYLQHSQINVQKIGDGMKGMIKDLYNLLPLNKIDALYEEKLKYSKVFAEFIGKIVSAEMLNILKNIGATEAYQEFITKSAAKGLDFVSLGNLNIRIIGLKPRF